MVDINEGNAWLLKAAEYPVPKNKSPFDETVTCETLAPKPLNVNPSGIAGRQVSSPSDPACVQPDRLVQNAVDQRSPLQTVSMVGTM